MTPTRRTLFLVTLLGLLCCILGMISFAYRDTIAGMHTLLTSNLEPIATLIKDQDSDDEPPRNIKGQPPHEDVKETYVVQTWEDQGQLIRSSSKHIILPLQPNDGLNQATLGGKTWQIYRLKTSDGYVEVGQPDDFAAALAHDDGLRALVPFSFGFILLSIAAWFLLIQRRPSDNLIDLVKKWDPEKLQPLPIQNIPKDLHPLIEAMNAKIATFREYLSVPPSSASSLSSLPRSSLQSSPQSTPMPSLQSAPIPSPAIGVERPPHNRMPAPLPTSPLFRVVEQIESVQSTASAREATVHDAAAVTAASDTRQPLLTENASNAKSPAPFKDPATAPTPVLSFADQLSQSAGEALETNTETEATAKPGAEPSFPVIDLPEIAHSCAAKFISIASETNNITVDYMATPGVEIKGNREDIRVLMNNLVENSVRFAPPGGNIVIRLYALKQKAVLEVSDNGPGVPDDEKVKIFRPFYCIPGMANTGAGLGLSVVKRVAEAHNATIDVVTSSTSPGVTFRVSFHMFGAARREGIG